MSLELFKLLPPYLQKQIAVYLTKRVIKDIVRDAHDRRNNRTNN